MRFTHNQILLIMPSEEEDGKILRNLLISKGYETISVSSLVASLQKVSEIDPCLIICHHQVGPYTGFRVYNSLQSVVSMKEIPFMLFMKEFRKEDVLVGLELGIDSFIIEPYEMKSLLTQIEKQIKKRQKVKLLETDRFQLFFENTPIAKFISENKCLIKVNSAFARIAGIDKNSLPMPCIDDVFNFSENPAHELFLHKCINGLKEYCLFQSVPLRNNMNQKYDIHMITSDYFGKNLFTGEVIPTDSYVAPNGYSTKAGAEKPQVMLTEREKQVLELSGRGLSIKQIADELVVSPRTIEKHRSNIMEKTKTSNIIEAIYFLHE